MHKINYLVILFLILLALILSCTVKDGEIFGFNPEYGNLLITSDNYSGATIFLDYKNTGRVTPALLENVSVGKHVVHLFLSTTRPTPDSAVVFVEKEKDQTIRFELNKVSTGDILVRTTPDSARIYINKLDFGFSPLNILGLPTGNYRIEILKSNYLPVRRDTNITTNKVIELNERLDLRRTVLLEHISNTSCPPCPEADELVEDLLSEFGPVQLIGIGYHAYWPSPEDPMYLAAKVGNDYRVKTYYKPASIPTAWIDGKKYVGNLTLPSYQAVRDSIEAHLSKAPGAVVEFINLVREDSSISGELQVTALQSFPASTVLQIALIEDVIDYESPPGTNGQQHFEAVFREFYPDPAGQTIALNTNEKERFNFSFKYQPEWGQDLSVVAFVQVNETKEILQAGWTRYPGL